MGLSSFGIGTPYSSIKGVVSAHNPTYPPDQPNSSLGWRPPIWGNASSDPTGSKARYCLVYQDLPSSTLNTLSETSDTGGETAPDGGTTPLFSASAQITQGKSIYNVFDAVFSGDYDSNLRITDYPVQSGQIYSYNAVLEPLRLTLEIGMSDTMQSYIPGSFGGNKSRSVAAFQLLQYLQSNRVFCTLNTRWGNFPNMLIENLKMLDNNQTFASAKFTVTFRAVQVAVVANVVAGTRPQSTQQTNGGTSNAQSVPQSVDDTNQIQEDTPVSGNVSINSLTDNGNLQTVAAGNYSSNPIASYA